ncbi:hypothetical protein AVEN_169905-1 [Araneus ventricosus]|uniref:Uncharacterized protein n=1 Tax=Araneus ventricosus TaxID=182803 RepID=A0A4Y2EYR4_ARAVE|nr:hypothetical protein AVEN_169905-1 [Araneus ventricosus]
MGCTVGHNVQEREEGARSWEIQKLLQEEKRGLAREIKLLILVAFWDGHGFNTCLHQWGPLAGVARRLPHHTNGKMTDDRYKVQCVNHRRVRDLLSPKPTSPGERRGSPS